MLKKMQLVLPIDNLISKQAHLYTVPHAYNFVRIATWNLSFGTSVIIMKGCKWKNLGQQRSKVSQGKARAYCTQCVTTMVLALGKDL